MKKRYLMVFLVFLTVLTLLIGCGASAEETTPPTEEKIYVVPDSHLTDDYDPRIYGIDEIALQLEIPDESVPLASTYVDLSDGASEREAEALAIHHAGLRNDDVSYLHSRYVEDADIPYYHIEFRSQEIPYLVWISESTGEILLFEEGV